MFRVFNINFLYVYTLKIAFQIQFQYMKHPYMNKRLEENLESRTFQPVPWQQWEKRPFLHLNFVLLNLAPCLLFPHANLIALINNYICVFLACSCDVSYKWFLQEARSDCQHSAETMSFTSRTTRRLRHPGKGLLNWEITYFWDCNLTPLWYLWFDFHFNMFMRENLC